MFLRPDPIALAENQGQSNNLRFRRWGTVMSLEAWLLILERNAGHSRHVQCPARD
jgi:hypothetical protein